MQHHDEVPLVIERLAFGGAGIGHLSDGKVCFVSGVIPGEKVKVRLRRRHANYVQAELTGVIEASPYRVEPKCPVYGRCGGCQYQHLSYERQLAEKAEQVSEILRRIGGVSQPAVEPVVPSPRPFHYRNRITVHSKSGRLGFFGVRSDRIVEVCECPIATSHVNALLLALRSSRAKDGEYPLREPSEFRGFRQVNDAVAGRLLEIVDEMAQPGGSLLVDGYCGAGFFSKPLSHLFELTIGIEWSTDAIRIARRRAGPQEIYLLGDVKRHLLPALAAAASERTTLLVDPPKEGLAQEVLKTIRSRHPARLLYVSCNPPTLARDIKDLRGIYALCRVCPIDMFPQTAKIEVAASLEKM